MSEPTTITDDIFDAEVLKSDVPVLVYFWATWCGPCRLVAPSVDKAAADFADRLKVVKMEVDPNPAAVETCKVEGVPALRLFKGGEMVFSHEGAITKDKLYRSLESSLS